MADDVQGLRAEDSPSSQSQNSLGSSNSPGSEANTGETGADDVATDSGSRGTKRKAKGQNKTPKKMSNTAKRYETVITSSMQNVSYECTGDHGPIRNFFTSFSLCLSSNLKWKSSAWVLYPFGLSLKVAFVGKRSG